MASDTIFQVWLVTEGIRAFWLFDRSPMHLASSVQ